MNPTLYFYELFGGNVTAAFTIYAIFLGAAFLADY